MWLSAAAHVAERLLPLTVALSYPVLFWLIAKAHPRDPNRSSRYGLLALLMLALLLATVPARAADPASRIAAVERELVGEPYEVGVLFSSRGIEIARYTSHDPDRIVLWDTSYFPGAVFVHNHSNKGETGSPDLDLQDLRVASHTGLAEIRAVAMTEQGLVACRAWRIGRSWPYFGHALDAEDQTAPVGVYYSALAVRLGFGYACEAVD